MFLSYITYTIFYFTIISLYDKLSECRNKLLLYYYYYNFCYNTVHANRCSRHLLNTRCFLLLPCSLLLLGLFLRLVLLLMAHVIYLIFLSVSFCPPRLHVPVSVSLNPPPSEYLYSTVPVIFYFISPSAVVLAIFFGNQSARTMLCQERFLGSTDEAACKFVPAIVIQCCRIYPGFYSKETFYGLEICNQTGVGFLFI